MLHRAARGEIRRALKLLSFADKLSQRIDEPLALGMVALARGIIPYLEGKWKTGLEHLDRAEVIFRDRCVGASWHLDTSRTFALWSLNFMGNVAELSRRWYPLEQEARDRGDLYANLSCHV